MQNMDKTREMNAKPITPRHITSDFRSVRFIEKTYADVVKDKDKMWNNLMTLKKWSSEGNQKQRN